ncbi:hypothetical protein FKP32DRAFT_1755108 [Trametes sanguinea]|nr:hypothetical protein FKP32DRAFT_1755108 [Trametes sanguinea]
MPPLLKDTVLELFFSSVSIDTDMVPFWDGYRTYLEQFGITLNRLGGIVWALPRKTPISRFPYAQRCSHEQPPFDGILLSSNFTCGRDSQQQDIVIKLIDKGSMEDRIYRTLAECSDLYDCHTFPYVLPPTAIIESPYTFTFVAMPMWGSRHKLGELATVCEVMTFIRCMLTALSFLHEKRIVHRDIHQTNIMINWYCYTADPDIFSRGLREHCRSSSAAYALYDFDLALQLPPETSLRDCRRPSIEAATGKDDYYPADAMQGELDYNPFAFDVGCLGNLFLYHFAELVTTVPPLAVLFARMTTSVVHERFSAAEALEFFHDIEEGLTPDILLADVMLKPDFGPVDDPDMYWLRLSTEHQQQWVSHRPPSRSWVSRILRRVCGTYTGWRFVLFEGPVNPLALPPCERLLSASICKISAIAFLRPTPPSTYGLAFAQDRANRNLILKIIEKGSSEHQINRHILEQQSMTNEKEAFSCLLAPVAVLDTPTDCSFLVMPMWGSPVELERMRRIRDIVQFVRCTLRGLSHLHQLRIVHRDIWAQNIVVNCHSPGATSKEFPDILSRHWQAGDVTYAFVDFGQSLQLPADTSIVDCRRSAEETTIGMNINKPVDGNLGEPFYNPFSFDVAALGFLFRYHFSEAVHALPGLAALFDRMTDYCPSRRMTAQEALQWFEEMIVQQPPACLDATVTLECTLQAMSNDDFYWSKLPVEEQLRWGPYRTPPRPLWRRLLGWFASKRISWIILLRVREFLQI